MKIKYVVLIVIAVVTTMFLLQNIVKQKNVDVIVVGTSADYPPYAFVDTKTNQVVGFDIDVAQEVVKRIGKKFEIKDIPFATLIFDLLADDIDIIAAGMTPTARRSRGVLFSQKYFQADPLVIITKKSNQVIDSIKQLQGKTVVVNTGYTADLYLSDKPDIELVRLKTPAESFMALQSGTVDAFVCAKSSLVPFLKKHNSADFSMTVLPDTGDDYALAVGKHNHNMLEQVNKALDAMKQDGTLQLLKQKWNLE